MTSYFFKLSNFLLDLLQNNKDFLWVIGVKGIGLTKDEAKMPINYNIKKLGSWEKLKDEKTLEKLNQETLNLILQQRARAIGIVGYPNIIWLDIDFYKIPDEETKNKIKKIIDELKEQTFVEKTASGGYHILFKNAREKNFFSNTDWIDVKYYGYVITYPSKLQVGMKLYTYEKISKIDLIEIKSIALFEDELIEYFGDYVYSIENAKRIKIENIDYQIKVNSKELRNLLNLLDEPLEGIKQLAKLLDCPGLYKAIEEFERTGKFPIKRVSVPLSIPRGMHFLFEVEFFTLLFVLYQDKMNEIIKIVEKTDYIDGIHGSPPEHTFKYTVLRGNYVVPKGICPFWQICDKKCELTPYRKLFKYVTQSLLARYY